MGEGGVLCNKHRHTNIPSHASPMPRHSPPRLHAHTTVHPRLVISPLHLYATPTHLVISLLHIHAPFHHANTPLQHSPTRPFAHKLHPRPPRLSYALTRQHNAFSHTHMPPTRQQSLPTPLPRHHMPLNIITSSHAHHILSLPLSWPMIIKEVA